jgi:hypothetical protein
MPAKQPASLQPSLQWYASSAEHISPGAEAAVGAEFVDASARVPACTSPSTPVIPTSNKIFFIVNLLVRADVA